MQTSLFYFWGGPFPTFDAHKYAAREMNAEARVGLDPKPPTHATTSFFFLYYYYKVFEKLLRSSTRPSLSLSDGVVVQSKG